MSIAKSIALSLIAALIVATNSPSSVHAQSRTWHYNSSAFTQPASLPWYAGTPVRPWVGRGLFAGWAPAVPVATTACNTCAPVVTRSVAYVPQTPCATGCQTYRPVSACNTCVAPTTVLQPLSYRTYRPYWTYRSYSTYYRPYSRPYWAYRPLTGRPLTGWGHSWFRGGCLSRLCGGGYGCANPCGTVGCTTGACGFATTSYVAPGCSTCVPAATSTVPYYAPSQPTQVPPSLEPTPSQDAAPKTFQETEKPVGDAEWNGGTKANGSSKPSPQLINPADRTTRRSSRSFVRPAIHVSTEPASQQQLDAAGWHPVSK